MSIHAPTSLLKARTVANLSGTIVPTVRFLGWPREMEVQYAEIVYVELKRNIHIPNDWPIRGIEGLVLYLAEKIISDLGSSYILQVNNVPAKLIQRGCLYVFEKVPHEKVEGFHLYDAVLPIGDRKMRVEIFSGENQEYCATALTSEKEMPYHTISSCLKCIRLLIFCTNFAVLPMTLFHVTACYGELSGFSNEHRNACIIFETNGMMVRILKTFHQLVDNFLLISKQSQ